MWLGVCLTHVVDSVLQGIFVGHVTGFMALLDLEHVQITMMLDLKSHLLPKLVPESVINLSKRQFPILILISLLKTFIEYCLQLPVRVRLRRRLRVLFRDRSPFLIKRLCQFPCIFITEISVIFLCQLLIENC